MLLSLFLSLSLGIVGFVHAEELATTNASITADNSQESQTDLEAIINAPTDAGSLVKPGITPDNFFYPFKLFFENVGSAFTFGHLAKAKRLASLAERRIAETKVMAQKKKDKAVEQGLKRYQSLLDNSIKQSDEAAQSGQDVSDIQAKISQMMEKHLLVLDKVKDQVPDQAKAVIQKVEDRFRVHQENILKKLAQKKPQKAFDLSREILRRRLTLLHQAIMQQKDKTAEEKLAEWAKYTDLLKEFKENGALSETSLEELENQLQVLKEIQDQISQDAPGLEDAVQSIYQKVLEKHLDKLKAFDLEVNGIAPCTLYVKHSHQNPPPWANFFEPEVAKKEFGKNSSTGAVLFAKVQGAIFVLSFGQGHHLIDSMFVEMNFGLKVVLNILDEESIRSIDKSSFEQHPTQSREQSGVATELQYFGVDIERDLRSEEHTSELQSH